MVFLKAQSTVAWKAESNFAAKVVLKVVLKVDSKDPSKVQ
jgi:hypothetical protein